MQTLSFHGLHYHVTIKTNFGESFVLYISDAILYGSFGRPDGVAPGERDADGETKIAGSRSPSAEPVKPPPLPPRAKTQGSISSGMMFGKTEPIRQDSILIVRQVDSTMLQSVWITACSKLRRLYWSSASTTRLLG